MNKNEELVICTICISLLVLLLTWLCVNIHYEEKLRENLCEELGYDKSVGYSCIKYEDIEKNNYYASKVKCDYNFWKPWKSECYLKQMPERFKYKIVYLQLKDDAN